MALSELAAQELLTGQRLKLRRLLAGERAVVSSGGSSIVCGPGSLIMAPESVSVKVGTDAEVVTEVVQQDSVRLTSVLSPGSVQVKR
jgi:hypothetical protein